MERGSRPRGGKINLLMAAGLAARPPVSAAAWAAHAARRQGPAGGRGVAGRKAGVTVISYCLAIKSQG